MCRASKSALRVSHTGLLKAVDLADEVRKEGVVRINQAARCLRNGFRKCGDQYQMERAVKCAARSAAKDVTSMSHDLDFALPSHC